LQVDHIDLYQIHWPDEDHVRIEEPWTAMAELQDAGVVRWLGLSNCDRALVDRCLAIRHVDSVQNQLSLLHRADTADLLAYLEEKGVGYLAYGPLAYGLLTGAVTRETRFGPDDWRGGRWNLGYYQDLFAPGRLERNLDVVEALEEVAEDIGIALPTLALRAALEMRGVTGVIAGSRNPDHVRANAEAGSLSLGPNVLRRVERLLDQRA
ncbi:MAG: aldo/keto reductase, partial [Actinomycetota bacterium]|nr:aldo/keto reductase [Actinomycetota bacterium]